LTQTPTPFFGIGAMRAGTTWLSELLDSYRDCRVMPFKELHFFDTRHGKYSGPKHYRGKPQRLATLSRGMVKRISAACDKKIHGQTGGDSSSELTVDESELGRNSMPWTDEVRGEFFARAKLDDSLLQIEKIVDYFSIRDIESYARYLRRHAEDAAAFGEITPQYALLPATAFAEMDGLLPGARFIFIMRDPVERLWSQVRYHADKAAKRGRKQRPINDDFRSALQRKNGIAMSDYKSTVKELESAVPLDRILYLFTETMTSPETGPAEVRRIETALGLNPAEIDATLFSTAVNASASAELDPESEAEAIRLFAPVYEFVERRFGCPRQWRSPRIVKR